MYRLFNTIIIQLFSLYADDFLADRVKLRSEDDSFYYVIDLGVQG
jgi:hypothetical protein